MDSPVPPQALELCPEIDRGRGATPWPLALYGSTLTDGAGQAEIAARSKKTEGIHNEERNYYARKSPRGRQNNTRPARMKIRLAVCAFDMPKNERGLMRMNSIRKRAAPVRIRYAQKTFPSTSPSRAFLPICHKITAINIQIRNS